MFTLVCVCVCVCVCLFLWLLFVLLQRAFAAEQRFEAQQQRQENATAGQIHRCVSVFVSECVDLYSA